MIIIECKYDKTDCINDTMCLMCFNLSRYAPTKKRQNGIKKNLNKQSSRMGSTAEMKNHNNLEKTLSSTASMTPNSGAGKIKGDEMIRGLVNWSMESKTQEIVRAKGHKQFTIKREWLDKLERESKEANFEFWNLVFSFKDNDNKLYAVIDMQQVYDIIATLDSDRKIAKAAQQKIDVADKHRIATEAENTALLARIDYLEALLAKHNIKED